MSLAQEIESEFGLFTLGKGRHYQRLSSQDHAKGGINLSDVDLKFPDYKPHGFLNCDETLSSISSANDEQISPYSRILRTRTSRQRYFSGWKVGAAASFITATILLVVNTTVTIWVWKNPNYDVDNWIGTLYEGSCQETKSISRWLHLIINVSSTIMLGCSNYCMQYLVSPNWDELVKAHGRRKWLHIGVPNLRNLANISWDRSILWVLLALSSAPLHLLFNSMVFSNLQANSYTVATASESFLDGGAWNISGLLGVSSSSSEATIKAAESIRDKFNGGTSYKNMSTHDCFKAFGSQYVSQVGDVLLIQDTTVWHNPEYWTAIWLDSTSNVWAENVSIALNGTVYRNNDTARQILRMDKKLAIQPNGGDMFPFQSTPRLYPSNGWRCPSRNLTNCDAGMEVPDKDDWKPFGGKVKYCLVETVQERCKLRISFPIALTVIMCNAIKVLCMATTLWKHRTPSLVTLGDAIAAFLDKPDPTTKNRCLYDKDEFQKEWNWSRHYEETPDIEPETYRPTRVYWAAASSISRWLSTYVLYIAAITFASIAIKRSTTGFSQLWHSGLGTLTGNNLLGIDTSIMGGVLLANIPQAVLSYLYLTFNALFTCMLVANEWTHYGNKPKFLRTSSPVGNQRSTYWLQVPWRYGLPLTILSGLLHWMASQSIFMVQITVTVVKNSTRQDDLESSISTCGYSPLAIIFSTAIGAAIMLGGILVSLWRYPAHMPLASSCSATISAACHPPGDDVDAAFLPVQWGVVGYDEKGVGHCTFTSQSVTAPVVGKKYA